MTYKVVIIGGGAAGPKTAAKLRRENKDIQIDLFTQENIISYSACGLPYYIADIIKDSNTLILRTKEDFQNIQLEDFTDDRIIIIQCDDGDLEWNNEDFWE